MKYLTLIFILISFNLYGQKPEVSKAETEQWIKSVVHTYGTGELKFQNGEISYEDPYNPVGLYTIGKATIKNLGGVKISGGTKGYKAVYLSCSEGFCVTSGMKRQWEKTGEYEYYENSTLMIQLNNDLTEDLKVRLIKAFNHLIKLYGGSAIDDRF